MKSVSNLIWLIIGLLLGGVAVKLYGVFVGPKKTITAAVADAPSFTRIADSMENAETSHALLLTRDSLQAARNNYRQVLGRLVFSDTTRSKPNVVTVIEKEYITVIERDTAFLPSSNTPVVTPRYGLRLPHDLAIENEHVGLKIKIGADSTVLTSLDLYGTVDVKRVEKRLAGHRVQRSVVFTRSNPYATNFDDAYIEEPRLTRRGLVLKQAKVAAWAIPVTFAATYLSFRQGWLK